MTHIRTETGLPMDGLEIHDIRLGRRITILMQTESLGQSILIAIWERIRKKLTQLSKKLDYAQSAETSESNTSSSTEKL